MIKVHSSFCSPKHSVKERKSMKRKLLLRSLFTICLLALFLVGSVVSSPKAYAGSNGQQLAVTTYTEGYSLLIVGHNQNGDNIAPCFNISPRQTTWYIFGYWWKGTVDIFLLNGSCGSGSVIAHTSTYVPWSQSGDWWYTSI
jgi:hypothetical protein